MSERTDQFKAELAALCRKYNCEIDCENHWTGYAECGSDIRITVSFDADYTVEPPVAAEDLDLGRNFDGKV